MFIYFALTKNFRASSLLMHKNSRARSGHNMCAIEGEMEPIDIVLEMGGVGLSTAS